MIPTGLKIGDIFEDETLRGPVRYKVTGFDGAGNYISKIVEDEMIVPVEEVIKEELPFAMPDDDEVQPVVEEVKEKKPAPKKTTKRKTAKKTSKK